MSINKGLRHTKRLQEILNAFLRNGLSHFLHRIGLTNRVKDEEADPEINMNTKDIGVKLRRSLQELGPAFIKLGQMASTRRDFVPEEIAHELEKLQDEVESISFEKIRSIVEQELGNSLENLFKSFSEIPLATASIGQVHLAELHTGEHVAIKVQRPDIKPIVENDLEILHGITGLMESRLKWAKNYHLQKRLDEFADSLREELDYRIEGRNCDRISKQFEKDKTVHIPKIYWEFTTKNVLTMERIQGIKVTNVAKLEAAGLNRKLIAKRLADSIFQQVLMAGTFHGDPHAGNIFVMPGNVISYIDFGMVGKMSEDLRYHFVSLLLDLKKGDSRGIINTFQKMDILEDEENTYSLQKDLDMLIAKYYDVSLSNISLGNVMGEIFVIAYRNKVQLPEGITLLGKAILTMEDIMDKLDPSFSIMKAVEPFAEKLVKERYRPDNIARHAWDRMLEDTEILFSLPRNLRDIMGLVKKGKIRLDINVTELQTLLLRMDKISNRVSFSIILLAFSILMAGLIIGASISGQTTMLWRLPVIEIGSIIASLMFLFMVFSIFRSGRM
ncbi:AarF/ABC1/UbiB kinase family protein [Aciduricibacillus chroicocephali]|uniref:AarF/ABC1/UbiB kinase family protein n=1 Tax=Aciduricibacillus chroicocephali TaxID=3054939 RepID=A0ABY9KU83_9BACI|nr:AarF/ABC1/UbiB kinase family protein [Bacillaceae bacterium 44XB]